jgi:hypothetical protein
MRRPLLIVLLVLLTGAVRPAAWGEGEHYTVNRAAVRAIPILRTHPQYNPATGSTPAPRRAPAQRYEPIAWPDEVSGKNFPLFAIVDADPAARKALAAAPGNSGLFARDAALGDEAFVARAWERAADGLNNILAVYGRGEKPRYPAIDSVSHYHDKKVPFIIVSGGYVHPKHTRFAEAIEMKRSLMRDFGVPADAIIIDPHARHTTTNVRNAARLIFRYGIPADRPALITTQQYHLDSIAAIGFDERNDRELGYRPYLSKRRLSRFELEWTPNVLSLHADPLDPLDP